MVMNTCALYIGCMMLSVRIIYSTFLDILCSTFAAQWIKAEEIKVREYVHACVYKRSLRIIHSPFNASHGKQHIATFSFCNHRILLGVTFLIRSLEMTFFNDVVISYFKSLGSCVVSSCIQSYSLKVILCTGG